MVEAIGQMSHIVSLERLQTDMPKLLPTLFGLYKRHHDPLDITQVNRDSLRNDKFSLFQHFYSPLLVLLQGLCSVIEACAEEKSDLIEPYLDQLMTALFTQVKITFKTEALLI